MGDIEYLQGKIRKLTAFFMKKLDRWWSVGQAWVRQKKIWSKIFFGLKKFFGQKIIFFWFFGQKKNFFWSKNEKIFFWLFGKKMFFFDFLVKKNFFFWSKNEKKTFFLLFGKFFLLTRARGAPPRRHTWTTPTCNYATPWTWKIITSTRCCSCKHCTYK